MIPDDVRKRLEAHWDYNDAIVKHSYELGQKCKLPYSDIRPILRELYLAAIMHGYKHCLEERA